MPDISTYGWTENYDIKWLSNEFPDDIQEILLDPAIDENKDLFERDEETDDEDC